MPKPLERASPGYSATSEVASGTQNRSENDPASGNENQNASDHEPAKGTGAGEAAALLQLLRGLVGGLPPPAAPALIQFDPDDPEADIESWCSINEVIIKHKDLKGTDLLLPLMHALRGRATSCLTKIQPDGITWENVKTILIARFAKPMLMQDYFDRVIQFKLRDKETAADAALRLWHVIETIPNVVMNEEAITGFIVSILSNCEHNIRRELNSHTITTKAQLCRILRGVSMKRQNDDTATHIENKRPRFSNWRPSAFNGTCHRCGEMGHKIINCPLTRVESLQPLKTSPPATAAPSRIMERRPVTCYACGKQGHVASACAAAAALRETNQAPTKQVKLCGKRAVTGELHVAGMSFRFLFDSGSECSLIKNSATSGLTGSFFHDTVVLVGIGNSDIKCNTQVRCLVNVQGLTLEILFHVVDDQYLTEPILLGRDIIDMGVHVELGENGVHLLQSKFAQFVSCKSSSRFVSQVDTDLDGAHKSSLLTLLDSYSEYFVEGTPTRRVTTGEMKIELIDPNKIVQRRPYRLSASERQVVKDKVSELLEAGVIRESNSPFASPILLVKKKDGSDRMVVDYRELNSNTRSDNYPLPRISDHIDRLHGAKYFTSLDMTSGFHCISVEPNSVERTAFVTPDGQYMYVAMPFGLKNAPSVFQRCIQNALKDCDFALTYIDDVCIPSVTVEQGLERLKLVLAALARAGFSLNMNKCKFLKREISYLGYEINSGNIKPNSNKVRALAEIPAPRTATQVRQFIGLASYFRQFIPNFSVLMAPLYPLTQHKGNINWTEQHSGIHRRVIEILTSEPVLAIYDPDRDIELHTDASAQGYGAMLIQRYDRVQRVVAYYSQRTSAAESRYHSYELETLAVVRAVEHFRHYLYGRCFTVRTDCNALKSSSIKKDLTPRVHRWWAILQSYDFNIEYKEGRHMSHVDFLSRNPLPSLDDDNDNDDIVSKEVRVLELQQEWLAVEQQRDSEITDIMNKWRVGDLSRDVAQSYDIRKGVVYRKVQRNKRSVWLPILPRSLVWSLISHVHSELKHLGYDKTLDKLYDLYWFPAMAKAVKKFVDACLVCRACKGTSGAKPIQLHSIPKVAIPWHTIHIDLSGKLSGKSSKKEYVSVIIDAFTKYVLLRLTTSLDASSAIESLKEAINLFGAPKRVIADQGRCYVSNSFQKFCAENNIELHVIAVGASRANGQVERVMQTLKNLLTITESSSDAVWRDELGAIQLALNSTKCRVTGYSATELMFGIRSQSLGISRLAHVDEDSECRVNLDEIRDNASNNIERVAESDTVRFNRGKAKIKQFSTGDFVFLKSCERNQTKLDRKFRGPFKVTGVLGGDRYELQHVDGSKRKYKYPHESLRKVPEGRDGLTEMAEALCNQAVEEEESVSADSSDMETDGVEDSTVAEVHCVTETGAVVGEPAGAVCDVEDE